MPQQELAFRRQTAVLWPFAGYDKNGQLTVGQPVELQVRWVEKRTERLDPQNNTIMLDAEVHVDREMAIGSCLWLGTIADMEKAGVNITKVMEVKYCNPVPDIKNRISYIQVQLMRRKDGMPPSA